MNARLPRITALVSQILAVSTAIAEEAKQPVTLEEVIVTAQRREESSQKTPISMAVYTAETLQSGGIHDLGSLAVSDPSINMTSSGGTGYLAVRGVASQDLTEIGDPSVTVSRDGFFVNRAFNLFSSFYDVDRVEVLKGPQGTLYGRNSSGGVINIISKRPGIEFGGYASVETGNFNALNLEGAFNAPLSNAVQLRVSGVSRYNQGYRKLAGLADPEARGDDEDARSLRAQLAFQPFDNFKGLVSWQRDRVGGNAEAQFFGTLGSGVQPDPGTAQVSAPNFVRLDAKRVRWELAYDGLPGGAALTYLGGHDSSHWRHGIDATGLAGPSQKFQFLQAENPATDNHELRLSSAPSASVFWQAGVFYFKDKNDPLDSGARAYSGALESQYLIHFLYKVKSESKAVFGQTAFPIADGLKLSLGARYTKDSKTREGQGVLNLIFFGLPVLVPSDGGGKVDASKASYHAGVDWTLDDSKMAYLKYDTGFKAGGFSGTCNGVATYNPEEVKAVELGFKARFNDGRLQWNTALFNQDYSGYQASQFVSGLCGGGSNVIQNAGRARIYGMESEFTALVGDAGKADVSMTLLNPKFTKFENAADENGNVIPSLKGNYLPNAPKLAATFGYEQGIQFGSAQLKLRADGKYQGSQYTNFFNYSDTKVSSYVVGNLSATYTPASDQWDVQAYVRNVTNEDVVLRQERVPIFGKQVWQFAPPRTYGLKLTARY